MKLISRRKRSANLVANVSAYKAMKVVDASTQEQTGKALAERLEQSVARVV